MVVCLVIFLIASIQATYEDNDEYDQTVPPEKQNKYIELSARFNCSALVTHHVGVKTAEVQTNSIFIEEEMNDFHNDTSETESGEDGESERVDDANSEEVTDDYVVFDDDSTEVPTVLSTKSKDGNDEKTRSKRGVVRSERLWTVDNISIIDGYSKVAFYPIKPKEAYRVKRMLPIPIPISSENDTMEECTAPFDDNGSEYNWYQIIVNHGGPPGKVNATLQRPKETQVLEPCFRPINNTAPSLEDLLYEYEFIKFEQVYRQERAFLRFSGKASEFVDIIGQLVWSPPLFPRRFYRVSYRKDDTGLYVNVHRRHKCTFEKNPRSVKCTRVDNFIPCERQHESESLPGLQESSLV